MLTLDGLRSFQRHGTSLGVVGFPIAHSLSPVFQNAALQALVSDYPVFRDWKYHRIEAPVEELQRVIEVCQEKGFRGLNLTLPHKVEVLRYLDRIEPVAGKMGAVNTLVFGEDGVSGYNTDGYGISMAVKAELGISLVDRPVVIMGAGGAARAACVQCLEEGCAELWVGNRSKVRLQNLLEQVRGDFPDIPIRGFEPGVETPSFSKESLLINATSLGLKEDDPLPVSPQLLETVGYVYDVVYGRSVTALVKEAKQLGLPASDGLAMLIFQGDKSLSLWTGRQTPIDVMRNAVKEFLGN
jgi:shikimate dehydrogenase